MSTLKQQLAEHGNRLGHSLAEVARTPLHRLLYGNGPTLADRLAASAEDSRRRHSQILNKACEVLIHV